MKKLISGCICWIVLTLLLNLAVLEHLADFERLHIGQSAEEQWQIADKQFTTASFELQNLVETTRLLDTHQVVAAVQKGRRLQFNLDRLDHLNLDDSSIYKPGLPKGNIDQVRSEYRFALSRLRQAKQLAASQRALRRLLWGHWVVLTFIPIIVVIRCSRLLLHCKWDDQASSRNHVRP